MKRVILVWICTLLLSVAPAPAWAEHAPWEPVGDGKELKLFRREVPGSPVVAFKGEGVVEAPPSRVAAVLLDHARAPEWVDRLESSRITRWISPSEYIEYNHIGTPIVLKDRDFVMRVQIELLPATKSLVVRSKSVEEPGLPETGYVRGELINARFEMTPLEGGKKTVLLAEMHADPKGSVAKWIVNLFQQNWPRKAFFGIRRQVARPDVSTPPEFAQLLQSFEKMYASAN